MFVDTNNVNLCNYIFREQNKIYCDNSVVLGMNKKLTLIN